MTAAHPNDALAALLSRLPKVDEFTRKVARADYGDPDGRNVFLDLGMAMDYLSLMREIVDALMAKVGKAHLEIEDLYAELGLPPAIDLSDEALANLPIFDPDGIPTPSPVPPSVAAGRRLRAGNVVASAQNVTITVPDDVCLVCYGSGMRTVTCETCGGSGKPGAMPELLAAVLGSGAAANDMALDWWERHGETLYAPHVDCRRQFETEMENYRLAPLADKDYPHLPGSWVTQQAYEAFLKGWTAAGQGRALTASALRLLRDIAEAESLGYPIYGDGLNREEIETLSRELEPAFVEIMEMSPDARYEWAYIVTPAGRALLRSDASGEGGDE